MLNTFETELTLFDINQTLIEHENPSDLNLESISDTLLKMGQISIDFSRVERIPRYDEASRENDAEHSFMLALISTELAEQFCPWLDCGLVSRFSIVHDLVEIITKDVATFTLNDTELAQKELAEQNALSQLCEGLPPVTRNLVLRYEEQIEPETRFVRLVDKILPVIVDILGPGAKVMSEDYLINNQEQLDENEARLSMSLKKRFPDPELWLLHDVRDVLAQVFSQQFIIETKY